MIVDRIHWLASYPKSGNTWVRAFLNAYYSGDVDINRLDFVHSDNKPNIFKLLAPYPVEDMGLDDWARMRGSALRLMCRGAMYSPLVVKTHSANATINGYDIFPDRFTGPSVYIVRDPRDVVSSFASHMGVDVRTAIKQMTSEKLGVYKPEFGDFLPQFLSSWPLHVRHWAERDDVIVVRYEDLLLRPHQQFRRILMQYGLSVDEARMDDAIESTRFDRLKSAEGVLQMSGGGFSENSKKQQRFFRSGTAGGWREKLTPKQIKRIETACGEQMRMYGYEPKIARAA